MKKFLTIVLGFFMTASAALAQPRFSSQGHKGKVAAAFLDSASKSQAFYTVGQDGFIIRWENGIGEHFQVSDKKIFLAAISPNAKEIAFYESDEASYHSVKIWDAAAKKTKRSFLYKNQITSLSYSAKGTCLIATANERNGVYFYTASNGKSFSKIKDYETTASWAKTSESEKNACPIAFSTTCGVNLEKSGSNKNLKPSLPPGSVTERTHITITSKSSNGISTFDVRSIPSFTPKNTTTQLIVRNSIIHNTRRTG